MIDQWQRGAPRIDDDDNDDDAMIAVGRLIADELRLVMRCTPKMRCCLYDE